MKFVFKNYYFENDKINKDICVALFSDIHFSNKTNINELYQINEQLKNINIKYIFIAGDIMDDISYVKDASRRNIFLDWFKSLGKIATTIISVGNHDFNYLENKFDRDELLFEEINNIDNVYLLDNSYYEDENIHVYGFTSTHDEKKDIGNTKFYIDELNKQNIEFNNQKLKILMAHSPQMLIQEDVYNKINKFENINLIFCGHMHNGMFFPFMEKIFKGNWGLISPYKSLFPKYSRGIIKKKYNNKEVTFIISGSICKLSASSRNLEPLGALFPASIEFINIKKR